MLPARVLVGLLHYCVLNCVFSPGGASRGPPNWLNHSVLLSSLMSLLISSFIIVDVITDVIVDVHLEPFAVRFL